MMVGTGVGARHGILIRDAAALEQSGKITDVLLDKTGTLTTGKLAVIRVNAEGNVDAAELLALAAAVESGSEHPVGKAIREYAQGRGAEKRELESFEAQSGRGVRGRVAGREVLVGTQAFVAESGVDTARLDRIVTRWEHEGYTVVLVAADGANVGVFALADEVLPDARQAIQSLHRRGLNVHMVTGDNERTARRVAQNVGIRETNVHARVLPEQKYDLVNRLQREGSTMPPPWLRPTWVSPSEAAPTSLPRAPIWC
jgi:Cu+-exporting ATPase